MNARNNGKRKDACMNIQIFGTKKKLRHEEAPSATFKERRITFQFIDLKEKG